MTFASPGVLLNRLFFTDPHRGVLWPTMKAIDESKIWQTSFRGILMVSLMDVLRQ
jgi:hypothetical protein